ncbi:TPM domain-containing protein, partial [Streptomyces sp. SID10853]|nr:TPM domain-containing protein [Streptomyces sp. SID10853]
RHLEESGTLAGTDPRGALSGAQQAGSLAGQAQYLAEQDVRTYAGRHGGDPGDGVAGAVLGGIVLGAGGAPVRFGGSGTRGRMAGDH